MSRAAESAFDELHLLTVETIKAEIQSYRDAKQPVPPALLAQAIKLMKDNGIDSPARTKKLRDDLAADMPDFSEFDSPTAAGVPH